ncbi:hypothetical protein GGI04_002853 [Coemansia thaxteri]|nr:hypothetical protein GGI04_002853 [Coemansia thaxteri]
MRPAPKCRTFVSPAVDQAIERISKQIRDPDIQQLLANTMANTLDTAIAWHHGPSQNSSSKYPYSFVITGDINAQWTRDSANQLLPLLPYAAADAGLQALIAGLINMQAEQIAAYQFANAYQPPARSGLTPGTNGWAKSDQVVPAFDMRLVFEAKFEIDSLAAFFKLSAAYARHFGTNMLNLPEWLKAATGAVDLLVELQAPTFGDDQRLINATVRFSRTASSPTESSFGAGRGNAGRRTGMVRTLFRPSDDSVIFPYLVPANAMLAVELVALADMLQTISPAQHQMLAARARGLADDIARGIAEHGVAEHARFGRVYAYEVDGYGGRLLMDDANVPSLLSLPYLGFVDAADPVYANTRRMLLSPANPWYFANGTTQLAGIGSPHTGFRSVWPMSVAVQALTSSNPIEIVDAVHMLVATTAGLGLIHESVNIDAAGATEYTRPWFAWCNGVVSELITRVVAEYPGLL